MGVNPVLSLRPELPKSDYKSKTDSAFPSQR